MTPRRAPCYGPSPRAASRSARRFRPRSSAPYPRWCSRLRRASRARPWRATDAIHNRQKHIGAVPRARPRDFSALGFVLEPLADDTQIEFFVEIGHALPCELLLDKPPPILGERRAQVRRAQQQQNLLDKRIVVGRQ